MEAWKRLRTRASLFVVCQIAGWRRKILGRHVRALLVSSENGSLLIDPRDFSIGKKLAIDGSYQMDNVRVLLGLLGPDSRVCFVGTHVGTLLVPIARRVASIVGIEANPQTFELLEMNLRLNGIANAELHSFAAGDREDVVSFYLNPVNSGGSKIKPQESHYEFEFDRPEEVRVPMRRLDDTLGAREFDLVVMDIEGGEYRALQGMPRILESTRRLQIEFVPAHLDKIAGVGDEAFLALLSPHFSCALVVGDPARRVYGREEFPAMLRAVRAGTIHAGEDLLFSKDPL